MSHPNESVIGFLEKKKKSFDSLFALSINLSHNIETNRWWWINLWYILGWVKLSMSHFPKKTIAHKIFCSSLNCGTYCHKQLSVLFSHYQFHLYQEIDFPHTSKGNGQHYYDTGCVIITSKLSRSMKLFWISCWLYHGYLTFKNTWIRWVSSAVSWPCRCQNY